MRGSGLTRYRPDHHGRRRHRIVSRQRLQGRDVFGQVGSQTRGLELVKEWWTVGSTQSLCRHSRREERSRTRRKTRSETKSQFSHQSCQWCGETRGQGPLRIEWDPSILGECVTCLSGEDPCGVVPREYRAWTWRPFSRQNEDAVNRDEEGLPKDVDGDIVKRLWCRSTDLIPSFGSQETTTTTS